MSLFKGFTKLLIVVCPLRAYRGNAQLSACCKVGGGALHMKKLEEKAEVFVDNLITSYAYLSAENIDIVQPSLEMVDSSVPVDILSDSSLDDWPSWAEAFAADKAANDPSLADVNEIIINVATNISEVQRLVVSYEEKISSYEEEIENLTKNIENITDLGQQLFERLERLETDASCRH